MAKREKKEKRKMMSIRMTRRFSDGFLEWAARSQGNTYSNYLMELACENKGVKLSTILGEDANNPFIENFVFSDGLVKLDDSFGFNKKRVGYKIDDNKQILIKGKKTQKSNGIYNHYVGESGVTKFPQDVVDALGISPDGNKVKFEKAKGGGYHISLE